MEETWKKTQTMLSPVVACGPAGLVLDKPIILTFEHCASVRHGQWTLSVFSCDMSNDEPGPWQLMSTLGQETLNTPAYVQVDAHHCHVMTDVLSRYALIGEPSLAGKAVKILRVAAFVPATVTSSDYEIRVYFMEDTTDALEGVLKVEKRLGCCLLEKPMQMLFQFGGANLCLALEELGAGWRCKLPANYQEIPFWHVWSGTQNGLHCSFALEHWDRTQLSLSCVLHVFQKSLISNRQVLQINSKLNENGPISSPAKSSHSHHSHKSKACRDSDVTHNRQLLLAQPHEVFRLPSPIKLQLGSLLDPPNIRGNDWRMLAQRLSVDRYINYFATKQSPTEHILDLWEARHREESAVTDLLNSLRVMGRMDAVAVIEKQLRIG